MNLRDFFLQVAQNYDHTEPLSSPTQLFLRDAATQLDEHRPAGFTIKGGGGKGRPTFTPWVGFFNPDETESPQEGIYVVYLFSSDLQRLYLSLNQGEDRLRKEYGDKQARLRLAQDAAALRVALVGSGIDDLEIHIDLGPTVGARQKAYTAANIVAVPYDVDALPSEGPLHEDLDRFLDLYAGAIDAKHDLLVNSPGVISAPGGTQTTGVQDPLKDFKPKNESDYVAHLSGKKLIKTRRHEKLVREYGEWATHQGFTPTTEHPRDLVLRKNDYEFLVEAKIVRNGNATQAVREAIGQLFTYRYFLYDDVVPQLVGLFSQPIGPAYETLLEKLEIIPIWHEEGSWTGSPKASSMGLA